MAGVVNHVFYGRDKGERNWRLIDVFFAKQDALDDMEMWVDAEERRQAATLRVKKSIPITLPANFPLKNFVDVVESYDYDDPEEL